MPIEGDVDNRDCKIWISPVLKSMLIFEGLMLSQSSLVVISHQRLLRETLMKLNLYQYPGTVYRIENGVVDQMSMFG